MKVKNVRYKAGGGAELVDIEVDDPGPGEVQVEVAACGICAWDIPVSYTHLRAHET